MSDHTAEISAWPRELDYIEMPCFVSFSTKSLSAVKWLFSGSSFISYPSSSGAFCKCRVSPCLSKWKLLITSPKDVCNDSMAWPSSHQLRINWGKTKQSPWLLWKTFWFLPALKISTINVLPAGLWLSWHLFSHRWVARAFLPPSRCCGPRQAFMPVPLLLQQM